MSKQDRQGVRRPADLEQKYSFGSVFRNQENESKRQKSEIDHQNLTMSQFISYANSAITALQKDIDTAEKLIAELRTTATNLDGRMKKAEWNISSHGDRLVATESDISSLDKRMDTAESNIDKHTSRLATAEDSITDHGERLSQAESDIASLKNRVSALERA